MRPAAFRIGPRRLLWPATLVLLLAGASLSGRALYLRGKAGLAAILIRHAWQELLRTGEPKRPWPWADTQPVARLRIPRLGYDEIVLEGASPRNLAFGPARMMNGAAPGEAGNLVLAGHRTSWFLPLQDVQVGDALELSWYDAETRRQTGACYRVARIAVIDPGDVRYLAPTQDDVLTLVTCYPFGPRPTSPRRYVVRARRESVETQSRPASTGRSNSGSPFCVLRFALDRCLAKR